MFQFQIDDEQEHGQDTDNTPVGITGSQNDQSSSEDPFSVGDRIKCDKHSGVVKYIGSVHPHPGVWLGIEWDDPSRGKHSGTVGDVEYFQSTQRNAASFIRPHKAKRGKDVFTALEQRYGHDQRVMSRLKLVDERITPRRVRYDELKVMDLAGKDISELGNPEELVKLCPKVEFLNLAQNLIRSWESISKVCESFEHLKGLDLSGNPILPLSLTCRTFPFPQLDHIILGSVNYSWLDVLSASALWPQVTNLQVPFNVISKMMPPTNSLFNLTRLDLEGNQICSWDEVIKLNVCCNLEYLNLCGNQISTIRFPLNPNLPRNSQTTQYFPNLKRLNVCENLIEDWISITELNKLQELTELRIELNPVFGKDTKNNNRQMVIARMGKLTKLEGVEINRQERRDAEIDYTKKFGEKWRNEGTELRFAVENPRYVELIQKFGESEAGEESKPNTQTLQSSLITLELIAEGQKIKPCTRKVMPNMTVQKLKMLLQRIFKASTPISYLGIISSQNSGITFPLENDLFDLAQYSVEDGDKVIVRWA